MRLSGTVIVKQHLLEEVQCQLVGQMDSAGVIEAVLTATLTTDDHAKIG